MLRYFGFLPLLGALAVPAAGQMPQEQPERVELSDLLLTPSRYDGKTVLVKGELRTGDMEDDQAGIYRLRGEDLLREVRVGQPRGVMDELRFLVGQNVEITGIFWDLATQCFDTPRGSMCTDHRLREFGALTKDFEREEKRYFIGVLAADLQGDEPLPEEPEPEEEEEPADLDILPGDLVDLRELVETPTAYEGKRISVVGKFRGNNLYSDLSIRTKKTPRDFIIKVAEAAIWVTGRRPRGKGFRLNPRMRRDTGKWLKVTGLPWMDGEMVYLKAEKLELVPEPEDPSLEPVEVDRRAEDAAEEPPPEVTFSIPLDGERGVPLDSEFRVQFSNDMNSASFDRNIDLLYADDDGFADPFPDMEIRYERANRTLVVIPGRSLDPEKEILLILYGDIVDDNGKRIVATAPDEAYTDAAVVLRFVTAKR